MEAVWQEEETSECRGKNEQRRKDEKRGRRGEAEATEVERSDGETKNDGEIKRRRILHSRIKLEGSAVKTCHAFHSLPPEFPFLRRLWLLRKLRVHAMAATEWLLHTGGHHSPGELG